jgi:putative DNA primase/helicase
LTDAQWKAVRATWKRAEVERDRAEADLKAKARREAAWIFNRAKPVTSHAYLTAKGVWVFGDVREYRGALLTPLRDVDGETHSLQFIGPDGSKRFLSGGRCAGCFFTLSDRPDGALVLCEGYATGASVHEATGFATVAAMNAGNLLAVAQAIRGKWPQREIIVAADSDAWTEGNPGLTKATEAAAAVTARLAVPQFKDITSKPTDWNDLHQLEGLAVVKEQLQAAATPAESDDTILNRLAGLPALEYERQRDSAAQQLGCRTSILDRLVDARRPGGALEADALQGGALNLADVELWPESVGGVEVLGLIAEAFSRFIALPAGAADALALWCAHAHCFDAFVCSPRLNISSPEKSCGKTTLRDVVAVFVPRPLLAENLSVAVTFRVVQEHRPVLLGDECDSWLRDNDELRGMLNSGHRRGGQALRCEGDDHEVRAFNVYSPAVLCGIGSLPGTLHDRSIVIRLERAKPGELRERFDSRRTEREQELCRKLARFIADNRERIAACDPVLPAGAFNRLADNWRPLFAIAEAAGGDWPQRAATAFAKLTSRDDSDAQGLGVMLLADVWQSFRESDSVRLFSKALVESLLRMGDHLWPEAHKGHPITETWLARRLRAFGVSPRLIRIGDAVGRGYELADFQEPFDRYLPTRGDQTVTPVTLPANKRESEDLEMLQPAGGVTLGKTQNPNVHGQCNGVTLAKPAATAEMESAAPEEVLRI